MNKVTKRILFTCAVAFTLAAVVFSYLKITPLEDDTANKLLNEVIPRICGGVASVLAIFLLGHEHILKVKKQGFFINLLWCVPCFLVVFANFPFSAIIKGTAQIEHIELVPLFIVKCFAIAIMEEAVFRGIVHGIIEEKMTDRKYPTFAAIFISSAIFGLWHLLNLLEGAGVFATVLQVGYSFLTGAMFAAVTIKTGNIWGAVVLHALFDVGGLIINDLGSGRFQDTTFWILTVVCGAICLIHVVLFIYKRDKGNEIAPDAQPKN
ncbi:MAG: CPBP family intramembrane metalloprotease [Clostridiales bacterium]|nr:CPBP family intramembrane metalloprotease [Clostridiales bacterium]